MKDTKQVKILTSCKTVNFTTKVGRPSFSKKASKAIVAALTMVGGTCALARLLEITPASISHWVRGRNRVPPIRAIQIEKLTNGKVKRQQLRPDIFTDE